MAKRDIWIKAKWVNRYGVPVERKRKKYAYWEKGQTYPQDPAKKRYLKGLEKNIYTPSGVSVSTFNRIWDSIMKGR